MLSGLAGLTATNGSTSAFVYSVPGPPTVQFANGLGPDASTSGATEAGPAEAGAATINAIAAVNSAARYRMETPIGNPLVSGANSRRVPVNTSGQTRGQPVLCQAVRLRPACAARTTTATASSTAGS